MSTLMRRPQGYRRHFTALAYAPAGYVGGRWRVIAEPVWLNAPGTVTLAHAPVVAALLRVMGVRQHTYILVESLGAGRRVLMGDPADTPIAPPHRFIGVVGVSFLTAH